MKKLIAFLIGLYITGLGFFFGWIGYMGLTGEAQTPDPGFARASAIFLCVLGLFFLGTGAGLILRKAWARTVVLVVSVFSVLLGIIMIGSLIFVTNSNFFPPDVPKPPIQALIISGAVIAVFTMVFPLLFILFLTRRSVAALFAGQATDGTPSMPLGIQCIAVLDGFGCLVGLYIYFFTGIKLDTSIGNFILPTPVAALYSLVATILTGMIAIGLFRRRLWAWRGFLAVGAFFACMGLFNLSVNEETLAWINSRNPDPRGMKMSLPVFRMFLLGGVVFQSVLMAYVYRKKAFFNAGLKLGTDPYLRNCEKE